jgi:para-nitrobenzyl esterase
MIAAIMSQGWINFARDGDPSQPGLTWPKYDAASRQTMIFNTISHSVSDPDRAARVFWST